eukprot:gene21198-biopygen19169
MRLLLHPHPASNRPATGRIGCGNIVSNLVRNIAPPGNEEQWGVPLERAPDLMTSASSLRSSLTPASSGPAVYSVQFNSFLSYRILSVLSRPALSCRPARPPSSIHEPHDWLCLAQLTTVNITLSGNTQSLIPVLDPLPLNRRPYSTAEQSTTRPLTPDLEGNSRPLPRSSRPQLTLDPKSRGQLSTPRQGSSRPNVGSTRRRKNSTIKDVLFIMCFDIGATWIKIEEHQTTRRTPGCYLHTCMPTYRRVHASIPVRGPLGWSLHNHAPPPLRSCASCGIQHQQLWDSEHFATRVMEARMGTVRSQQARAPPLSPLAASRSPPRARERALTRARAREVVVVVASVARREGGHGRTGQNRQNSIGQEGVELDRIDGRTGRGRSEFYAGLHFAVSWHLSSDLAHVQVALPIVLHFPAALCCERDWTLYFRTLSCPWPAGWRQGVDEVRVAFIQGGSPQRVCCSPRGRLGSRANTPKWGRGSTGVERSKCQRPRR